MNEDDLKSMWQALPADTAPMQEAELARRAQRFQRRIAHRNFLEYGAALLVCAGFLRYLWLFPDPLMRAGSVLVILGMLLVVWQMHRRTSSRPMPGADAALPCRDFHRTDLIRQRDALRSVWLWYVSPLIPGMVVFRWGVETNPDPSLPFARGWMADGMIAAVMLGVIVLNLYAAHRLQRQIEQLDQIDQIDHTGA